MVNTHEFEKLLTAVVQISSPPFDDMKGEHFKESIFIVPRKISISSAVETSSNTFPSELR
jgi:hypothetical protein